MHYVLKNIWYIIFKKIQVYFQDGLKQNYSILYLYIESI